MKTMPRRMRAAALVLPVAFAIASAGCDLAMHHYSEKQTAEWRKTYDLQAGRAHRDQERQRKDRGAAGGRQRSRGRRREDRVRRLGGSRKGRARWYRDPGHVLPDEVHLVTKMSRMGGGLFGGGNQSVEYTVKVPVSADVNFSTVNGGVELTGLKGRITAEATNGGIKAHDVSGRSTPAPRTAASSVELAAVSDSGVKLGCINGGIELRLPSSAKATISAHITNGGINASGLTMETIGESSKRRLEARLNGGGPQNRAVGHQRRNPHRIAVTEGVNSPALRGRAAAAAARAPPLRLR